MVFTTPSYCSGSFAGAPEFGAPHPPVDQIKRQAQARQEQGHQPRSVDLVYKFAKEKGGIRAGVLRGIGWLTGHHFRSTLHWALRIGSTYFDLHLNHETGDVDFVTRIWTRERLQLIANVHILSAFPTVFPFPKNSEDDEEKIITNLRNQSQKWMNRTWSLFISGGIIVGSIFYVRDLVTVAITDHGAITGAFARRSKAKKKAKKLTGEGSKDGSIEDQEYDSTFLEEKLRVTLEAVHRFWNGDGTWEEIIRIWAEMMLSEGITWAEVSQHVRQRRGQAQQAFSSNVRQVMPPKEKLIRGIVDVALFVLFEFSVIFGGAAVLELLDSI